MMQDNEDIKVVVENNFEEFCTACSEVINAGCPSVEAWSPAAGGLLFCFDCVEDMAAKMRKHKYETKA